MSHDGVNEVLVSPEVLADPHEWQNLRATFHSDSCWKFVSVTIKLSAMDKKVSGNLVIFDPDVSHSEREPLVDWAIRLVEVAEVPCCLCSRDWDAPETTNPRNA